MRVLKFVPFHLTISLIIGICIGYFYNFQPHHIIYSLVVVFLLLILSYSLFKRKVNPSVYFSLITLITFLFIGLATITFHSDLNKEKHYSNFIDNKNNPQSIILKIQKNLKPTLFHTKYEAEILQINDELVKGKILLNIAKDTTVFKLKVDDVVLIKNQLKDVNLPKNPYQFNYKKYLEKQNIYKQITTTQKEYILLNSNKTTLNGLADKFREKVNNSLKKFHFKKDELSIINALLLGQRQDISKEIIDNYSKAGAIHILAVSGLHVGIILWLLSFILKPLEYFKNGKTLKLIIAIIFLWCFAFIAGLSPSVIRAVTMFTAIAISLMGKRQSNIYHNLIISIFILLLFNPFYLFDVGFQMSYLAVFFIVWIQPIIYRIWIPKWKVINYFWEIFTVSVAAQIGVLPLSLYYFHQFPGLFFITNLAIIPLLGLILGLGVLIIFLSISNFLPQFLADFYQLIIGLMNKFIEWVAYQESFLFQNIAYSLLIMLTSYLLIVFIFRWIEKKSFARLKYLLFSLILLQSVFIYQKWKTNSENEFIIFNKSRTSIIGEKKGDRLTIFHSLDSLGTNDNIIKSYITAKNISKVKITDSINNSFFLKRNILLIDSLGLYNFKKIKPNTLFLTQSPKINLERVIKILNPKQIIVDNSNYKSYVTRWKETSLKHNISFYYTNDSGAYLLKD